MKKVVQIGLDVIPSTGGSAVALHWIRDALGGGAVSFTSPESWGEIREGDGIRHLRTGPGLLGRLYHKPDAIELAQANEVFSGAELLIVHSLYRYHAHWACRQARKHRIPYWAVLHGGLDPYVLSYRRFRKMRWLRHYGLNYLRGAKRILFATVRERDKALPFLNGVTTETIPWPVEPIAPANSQEVRMAWREELGVGKEERILLYLGRLHEVKRPVETLEAFRQVTASNLHLVLAGPGETYSPAEIRNLSRLMGIRRVHVPGPVYSWRKAGLLVAADGLVSLSAKENFNIAAAEAMSAGKPVILSPGNDLQGELTSVDCGWLLKTDHSSEATRAMQEFASMPRSDLDAKGRIASSWATEHLGFEQFQHHLQDLIKQDLS